VPSSLTVNPRGRVSRGTQNLCPGYVGIEIKKYLSPTGIDPEYGGSPKLGSA
jgi:hypothetical protein